MWWVAVQMYPLQCTTTKIFFPVVSSAAWKHYLLVWSGVVFAALLLVLLGAHCHAGMQMRRGQVVSRKSLPNEHHCHHVAVNCVSFAPSFADLWSCPKADFAINSISILFV